VQQRDFVRQAGATAMLYFYVNQSLPVYPEPQPQVYYDVWTRNLVVDTYAGDGDNVIVVGAHSDSVPAGPGINDDGTGTASNLEILLQYYKLYGRGHSEIKNRVRFVFFGAEELGLLGSYAYVASLNASNAVTHALDRVVCALDHDMFGG
jgi:Zn-dependent M28 family amino/carboxypeptidase